MFPYCIIPFRHKVNGTRPPGPRSIFDWSEVFSVLDLQSLASVDVYTLMFGEAAPTSLPISHGFVGVLSLSHAATPSSLSSIILSSLAYWSRYSTIHFGGRATWLPGQSALVFTGFARMCILWPHFTNQPGSRTEIWVTSVFMCVECCLCWNMLGIFSLHMWIVCGGQQRLSGQRVVWLLCSLMDSPCHLTQKTLAPRMAHGKEDTSRLVSAAWARTEQWMYSRLIGTYTNSNRLG